MSGNYYVDIFVEMGSMSSAEEWRARGLEKYGLIVVNDMNEVM